MSESETTRHQSPAPGAGRFAATRWTLVMRARGESSEAKAALGALCDSYYEPVFRFVRGTGFDEETARELSHAFFAHLLTGSGLKLVDPKQGRFRSFLLGAVKHFLAAQVRRGRAAKRGGGRTLISLDDRWGGENEAGLTVTLADPTAGFSDAAFDRQWAVTLVDRAVSTLAVEAASAGKGSQFEALKPWLLGEVTSMSQADVARQLGLSDGAVKVAVHRLRRRIRDLVKTEIAQTVSDAGQVQEELRYLVEVLANCS